MLKCLQEQSSSLWGCELKVYRDERQSTHIVILLVRMWVERWGVENYERLCRVILLVRMWVERDLLCLFLWASNVILLVRMWVERTPLVPSEKLSLSHPPCEDVSWKSWSLPKLKLPHRHPPCEDVSWKICYRLSVYRRYVILLVRMWVERGMEILMGYSRWVILLVRMWVERSLSSFVIFSSPCHPPCEDVSWKCRWNRTYWRCGGHPPCEDVSWKFCSDSCFIKLLSHPPCEDVSWKIIAGTGFEPVSSSSSMWGCELKRHLHQYHISVSPSSSMWGCELKREWCKNVWYSSIALFMRKIVPSNDMNSIYVMRKRGELKEYKLQFLSIKKGLHY